MAARAAPCSGVAGGASPRGAPQAGASPDLAVTCSRAEDAPPAEASGVGGCSEPAAVWSTTIGAAV
eukprot:11153737-Alexandrium_andersonii.AAC.1